MKFKEFYEGINIANKRIEEYGRDVDVTISLGKDLAYSVESINQFGVIPDIDISLNLKEEKEEIKQLSNRHKAIRFIEELKSLCDKYNVIICGSEDDGVTFEFLKENDYVDFKVSSPNICFDANENIEEMMNKSYNSL